MEDIYYKKIKEKIEKGEFVRGKVCNITDRNVSFYAEMIQYGKCKFESVPSDVVTREFLITCFNDDGVYEYIKGNIESFDRQFFKDLIATNSCATHFNTNCFTIMPLEYIDEEMCSLAIINSTDYIADDWFYTVVERKKEALTEDLWALGARLYARVDNYGGINFLRKTPPEYKTRGYYKEMCCSSFNVGAAVYVGKRRILASLPTGVVTPSFIQELLFENVKNIIAFGNEELEQCITYINSNGEQVTEKVWQYAIRYKAELIRELELNDVRVEGFLSLYPKNSFEYNLYFMEMYHKYLKKKENPEEYRQNQRQIQDEKMDKLQIGFMSGRAIAMSGGDASDVIDEIDSFMRVQREEILPINSRSRVPYELSDIYDKMEFLKAVYDVMGIKIVRESDELSYAVIIPENLLKTIDSFNHNYHTLSNNELGISLTYFHWPRFYDREFYVSEINLSPQALEEIINRSRKTEKSKAKILTQKI